MDRIDNVDLREALRRIAENNTAYHLENDLNGSFEFMVRAARMDDPAEKSVIWISYPSGVDWYSERQAFQTDTRDYNGIQFHVNGAKHERKLAYAVEVMGVDEDDKLYGHILQIDIVQYAEQVKNDALTSQTMRLYQQDGGQITMTKAEYDNRYPHDLPKAYYRRNEPDDPSALQVLMDKAQADRAAACELSDLWHHTSKLYDERRAFYSGQLLGELSKLQEPNGPGKKNFSVELSHYVAYSYGAEQLSQLLDALPYDNAMFAVQKGKRDMRLVVPSADVLRHRQAEWELDNRLWLIAEYIVWDGSQNTTQGNWIHHFDSFPPELADTDFITTHQKAILAHLEANTDVVADVEIIDNAFDVCYCLAYCPNAELYDGDDVPEPEVVHGYTVEDSVLLPDNRGFALATDLDAAQPFVTWQFTEENGQRDYYWEQYFASHDNAFEDFHQRVGAHKRVYSPVEKYSQTEHAKPSILARLQEGKKAAAQSEDLQKAAPKRDSEWEV